MSLDSKKIDWEEYAPILKLASEYMDSDPEWAVPLLEIIFQHVSAEE